MSRPWRAFRRLLLAALAVGPASAAPAPGPAEGQSAPDRASFAVAYHGQVVPWRVFLLRALPGEEVGIEVRPPGESVGAPPDAADGVPPGEYRLDPAGGDVERTGPRSWIWTASEADGFQRLVVRRYAGDGGESTRDEGGAGAGEAPGSDRRGGTDARDGPPADSVVLNAAVLVPLAEARSGRVRGYRVGRYPDEVFRGLARYRKPRGFVRVTKANGGTPVSPHFRLRQFSVRRPRTWPKYTVLHERLLLKLELLVERARRRGVPARGWRVLSGYRSPWYNRSIGRPRFSRHIFGDAGDVYVDVDADGRMDDLTGDGRVDVQDADVLHDIVDRMDADPDLRLLLGGLGKYRSTPNHGPFIHVDTRGYRARW